MVHKGLVFRNVDVQYLLESDFLFYFVYSFLYTRTIYIFLFSLNLRRRGVVFASRIIIYDSVWEKHGNNSSTKREGGGWVGVGVVLGVEIQSVEARPPPLSRATLQARTVTEGDYGQIIALLKVCTHLFYSVIFSMFVI